MPEAVQTKAEPPASAPTIGVAAQLHRQGRTAEAEAIYLALLQKPSERFDALHMLGVLRSQQRRPAEAVECLRAALTIKPGAAAVLSNLGLVLASQGQYADALANYEAALAAKPDLSDAWNNRGNVLMKVDRWADALESFDRAIAVDPNFAEAHNNRGNALQAMKRPEDALASYERSIANRPDYLAPMQNRGVILVELDRPREALECLDRVLQLEPDYEGAYAHRGNALMKLGRVDEALDSFDKALSGRGGYANALASRGNALAELGRYEDALASYDRALQSAGDYPELLTNRGSVLRTLKRPVEALESLDRALVLRPAHVGALNNRGNALRDLDRLDEAAASYESAVEIDPGFVEGYNNLGATYLEMKRTEEAVACFDRVVALRPDYAEARLNRALARLLSGDFAASHEDYEHRWRVKVSPPRNSIPQIPAWQGETLSGKHIVVYEEQGLGDIIQFFRFLPRLLGRGAKVSFLLRRSMHRLFRPYAATIHLIDAPSPGVRYDYQCALMSLPFLFATTVDTTPGDVPYLFPEPVLVAKWKAAIGESGLKIGICWQGNPGRPIDFGRSIPLALFAPLASIPGTRLISLQRFHGLEQLATLPDGMAVETLGPDFEACPGFEETVAAMACLDLVVSCDTSIAHAAGALGRPVWIALKYASEWRWLHDRHDSLWYPTARLYRQTVRHDWRSLLIRIADDVVNTFAPATPTGVGMPPGFEPVADVN